MVVSGYLLKPFYWIAWILLRDKSSAYFYCADYLDYVIAETILPDLGNVKIAAKNRTVQRELADQGVDSVLYPVFPATVIMARHALHKFPIKKIKKIGMRHGAYHFKSFIDSKKYNSFDLFLFTSESEVESAKKAGIKVGRAVGFPKIDNMFNGAINENSLEALKSKLQLDKKKKTVLFSATWEKSGMSAVEKWYKNLTKLSNKYNLLVTLHPWVSDDVKEEIENTPDVFFIKDKRIAPYLMVSDLLVSDTSSIIAEFCSLDRPIITFIVEGGKRLTDSIKVLLEEISHRVEDFEELENKLESILDNPSEKSLKRKRYNEIMFDALDGSAGKRAAAEILNLMS